MSRRVSLADIQLVQNLIERCLQLYMTQKEVVQMLLARAKIEPAFTELVWQKLEEENPEFFKAYYSMLKLKMQIEEFNRLLGEHAHLMGQLPQTAANGSPFNSNGSHLPALPQNPSWYTAEQVGTSLKPENNGGSGLHNVYNNGGSSLHSNLNAASVMLGRGNGHQSMLSSQSSNTGLILGNNGGRIKSEPGYPYSSPYMFGAGGNVLEARPTIGDAQVSSFTSVDSNSHSLNEALLDPDTSEFGFLGQIPRNFSLSDLTADFSQSSEILESYARSPFLPTANENFLQRGKQDNGMLDSTPGGGLSYDGFRSVNN